MSSRRTFAGQPYNFRCRGCKTRELEFINLTGRTREQKGQGANYHYWGNTAYEYECRNCWHSGWSRHPDIAEKYEQDEADIAQVHQRMNNPNKTMLSIEELEETLEEGNKP